MKRVRVTLHGRLIHFAERTIELELSDDDALTMASPDTLNALADADQVPWSLGDSGYLEPTDFTVEDCVGRSTAPSSGAS